MKVVGLSEKAVQFEGLNSGLAIAIGKTGPIIRVVELDNWLRIMIEVNEEATHENIRELIPYAISWRDRLLEYQGPWLRGGKNEFLERWSQYHAVGRYSYKQIAEKTNLRLSFLLSEHNKYRAAAEQSFPEIGG